MASEGFEMAARGKAVEDEVEVEVEVEREGTVVDLNLPPTKRPLTGFDLQSFQAKFNMTKADLIYALAITTPLMLNKQMESRTELDFPVELLLRLYDRHPGPAPWRSISPAEGLEFLYGDVLKRFQDTEHGDEAKNVCERRMVQCFGRHSTTAYRWFDLEGRSKQVVARVLAKLSEFEDHVEARETLEGIARLMYRVRGDASELTEPLPTQEHPPVRRKRGPVPGSKRAAAPAQDARKSQLAEVKKLMEQYGVTADQITAEASKPATKKARSAAPARPKPAAKRPATKAEASIRKPAAKKAAAAVRKAR
jgi:hypothetical protein